MLDAKQVTRHRIRVAGEEGDWTCREDEPVLFALERRPQRAVRVGCRQGGCGACRVKVLSGEYDTGKMSSAHVSDEEAGAGYALSCRLYPRSDLEVEPAFRPPGHARRRAQADTED